ncbi:MAG TPA: ABC transporter substrate-binding protein [Dermatophilaceae bacterium]|nr:ABC transporter substrate-binding protein [Dermatophilaceae bacterium]
MRGNTRTVLVAAMSATALLAAGCGGGGDDEGAGSGTSAAKTGGEITVRGCNPQNPLVPTNTNETCGGNVLDAIFARLVHYNSDDASPENDLAESIETSDNQNFTVKLKPGQKFADGTPITSKSFVDAWNYGAYGPNAQLNSYFFEPIEGSKDVACPDEECKAKPKTDKMSGLAVVDDTTFTIKTSSKVSNLPVRLGYSAFAPLPDSFFADPKAFGEKPIGSGPYKLDSWAKNQAIVVSKNPNYAGKFSGKVDKITFKIYQDPDAAYNDVIANQLDVTDDVPTSALIDDKYKTDLPDRNLQREVGGNTSINLPPVKVDPTYENPKLRHAISMAINRDEIVKQIFNGSRTPATGWVPPGVDGYKAGACGEYCTFDAAKAKAAFDEAGGYKGTMTLTYNADQAHKDWTEATCNSIKNALGVDCQAKGVVDFATFRAQITDRKQKGMFRTAWQMDYPSIENFLAPIYGTGAGSNDGDYSNPEFDKKLTEAAAAPSLEAANKLYQEAEALLKEDMPAIPMWYTKRTLGWSDKVANVKSDAFGVPDYRSITVK